MTNDAGRKPEGAPERSPKAGVGGLSERLEEQFLRRANRVGLKLLRTTWIWNGRLRRSYGCWRPLTIKQVSDCYRRRCGPCLVLPHD